MSHDGAVLPIFERRASELTVTAPHGRKARERAGEEEYQGRKPTRWTWFQMSLSAEPDHPSRMQTPRTVQCAALFVCNLSSSTCGIVFLTH